MDNLVILKGVILIIGGLILFFGISYFIYYIFNRFGKQKNGKIAGFVTFAFLILFTTCVNVISGFPSFFFKEYFFFKSSAVKELKQMDLVLYDDFKVLKNEIGGFTSYIHTFELKISKKDLQRLVGDKELNANKVMIEFEEINSNGWKKVIVDVEKNILTYEYIMD